MERKYKVLTLSLCISTVLGTSGCASFNGGKTIVGCAWGATVGTVAGLIVGKGDIRYAGAGAVAGLIAGCGVGYYMDQREEELENKAKESGFHSEFERLQVKDGQTTFSVDAEEDVIASQVALTTDKPMFKTGESKISDPQIRAQLDTFLAEYVKTLDSKSKVYVVGHTDSSGSAVYNQKLSEKRAYYIASRLHLHGLEKKRIFFEGVGENQPIASNLTQEGKAKNRRFELIDVFVDDVGKGVASLDQVILVSESKKQRIENVMTPEALDIKAREKALKIAQKKAEREGTNLPAAKLPTIKPKDTKPSPVVKTVNVSDHSPLKLYGKPLDNTKASAEITATLGSFKDDSWSLFSKAHANDLTTIQSCGLSEPKVKSTIQALGSVNYTPSVAEGLPTLFGSYWYGKATSPSGSEETMVVLGPVFVNKETYESQKQPKIHFTKNYQSSNQRPNYSYKNNVETYRGDNSVLYRVYPTDNNAKFECADFIFNAKGQSKTRYAEIIYASKGTKFSRVMELRTSI